MVLQFELHTKQMEIFDAFLAGARFIVISCGRRFGKTMLCAFIVIWDALKNPGHNVWIVAPTFPQTDILWEMIIQYLPREYIKKIYEGRKLIELRNGSRIWAKSADNPQALVGRGLDLIVFDEASMVPIDAWNFMRPALGDRRGRAVFPSTPKGKNWFYDIFMKDPKRGGDDEDYVSFQYPSMSNEFLDPVEFEKMSKDLPEIMYRQEILADFIDSGGEVFRNLNRVLEDPETCLAEPVKAVYETDEDGKIVLKNGEPVIKTPGHFYVGGGDLGKYQDFTVLFIADLETNKLVFYERFNKLDWDYQKVRISSVLKKYNDACMYIDSTGVGDPIVEDLLREGANVKAYKFSTQTKRQAIENLMKMIDETNIRIPNIPEIKNEFQIFGYEQTKWGHIRYCAPDGHHDDIVIAAALCVWGLDQMVSSKVIGVPSAVFDEPIVLNEEEKDYADMYDDDDRVVNWDEEI